MSAVLLLAMQAMAPAAAAELFMSVCAANVRDSAAFDAAVARAGFRRIEDLGREARYRSGDSWVRYFEGDYCRIDVLLADGAGAGQVIEQVSSGLGLARPRSIAMHPPGRNSYRWPAVEGTRPRFYLDAQTIRDQQGVSLDLSIHAGPGQ